MKTSTARLVHGFAGRREAATRSDCFVDISVTTKSGIIVKLTSKVDALYGKSIVALVEKVLNDLAIRNARVSIEDQGAVPFVIAARVEAAVKRALPELKHSSLLPVVARKVIGGRSRLRRTRLYLPGNEPHFFLNAGLHRPDCIILDLEDSVPPAEKDAARILVRNALAQIDFGNAERMVRINQLPAGLKDLQSIAGSDVQTILIPKCESATTIHTVERELGRLSTQNKQEFTPFLLPIIESAQGVVHAYEIATASERICAIAIGLEDYTADIGAVRTREGAESLYARNAVVIAAKAAGVQALDSVYSDVGDDEGLRRSALEAKSMGFDGKGCIHPRQIRIIHQALSPTPDEVDYARRVVGANEEAQRNGSGVVALGSKMIDPPVVKRAQRVLTLAALHADEKNR